MKIGPGGQNRVLPGVKIKCCLGSTLSASTQSQCLCGCTQFWPLVHSIWTPGSTLFWPQAALYFDPQGLFSELKKFINHIFKRYLDFLKKAIHLIIFLRFYCKKYFFNLGIPLSETLDPSCTLWYALTLWCTKMHWAVLRSLSALWQNAIFHHFRLKKWTAIVTVMLPVFFLCIDALSWCNRDGLCFLIPDAQDWIALDKTVEWVGVPFGSCCCCCVIKPLGHHFSLPG